MSIGAHPTGTGRRTAGRAAGERPSALHISIRSALGTGPTALAAFDAALRHSGVADRNLVYLSSIIPPNSIVDASRNPVECPGQWGDRLYVVVADERVERHHEEAWAGIGWVQEVGSGEGLFVEHHGHSESQVEADIASSLDALTTGRPSRDWGRPEMSVVGAVCDDQPICALSIAVFASEPWPPQEVIDLR